MCVIVNLDLVIPAVLASELSRVKRLSHNSSEQNIDNYVASITISADRVTNYAMRMKSWDLGRVIVNFSKNDAENYLSARSNLFSEIDNLKIYSIILPQETNWGVSQSWDKMIQCIKQLSNNLNYSERVIKTAGLSNYVFRD